MERNSSRLSLLLALMLAVALAGSLQMEAPRPHPGAEPEGATTAKIQAALGKLPLYFIENRGQLDPQVAYYVQGKATTIYFTAQGVTFALTGPGTLQPAPDTSVHRAAWRPRAFSRLAEAAQRQRWAVKLEFVGATPNVTPIGQDPTPAVVSYFKGPQD